MKLLDRLKTIQKSYDFTDQQFAEKLDISVTLWIYTKQGKRTIGRSVIEGALAAFPDNDALSADVLHYLRTSKQTATPVHV